ncbi:MAG: CBS domain-containing protein [Pseudomonadota bacterium]
MSEQQHVRVSDVMTPNYQTVDGMMTIADAIEKIKSTGAVALIVNKRHDDDEYGIVLLGDIAREVLAVDRAPERVNVYEIMSKPVVAVDPYMDIRYCARLFGKLGFSYAPVLDGGKLKGIVSYADLVLKGLCY